MRDLSKFSISLPEEKLPNPYVLALRYCLINVFGSYLSILVAGVVFILNTVDLPGIKVLLKNGEVIIISISLVLTCIYTLYENIKSKNNLVHFTFWSSILVLILSIIVYVIIVEKQYFSSPNDGNLESKRFLLVKRFSIFIALWAIVTVYYSQVIHYKKQSPPLEDRKDDLDDLKKKVKTIK
jgi:lysylphosphatidylglycerol synthetase-like protein (DUF2156 family)